MATSFLCKYEGAEEEVNYRGHHKLSRMTSHPFFSLPTDQYRLQCKIGKIHGPSIIIPIRYRQTVQCTTIECFLRLPSRPALLTTLGALLKVNFVVFEIGNGTSPRFFEIQESSS